MILIGTIVVGFVMMTLGMALLFVGDVPFIAGRRLSARRSRLIGAVLVSFLPLALAVRFAVRGFFGSDAVEGPVVTSFVFSFCCLATLLILFRVMFPKRPPRQPVKTSPGLTKENPFGGADQEVIEPEEADQEVVELEPAEEEPILLELDDQPPAPKTAKKPAAKKPAKPERNPFDFS